MAAPHEGLRPFSQLRKSASLHCLHTCWKCYRGYWEVNKGTGIAVRLVGSAADRQGGQPLKPSSQPHSNPCINAHRFPGSDGGREQRGGPGGGGGADGQGGQPVQQRGAAVGRARAPGRAPAGGPRVRAAVHAQLREVVVLHGAHARRHCQRGQVPCPCRTSSVLGSPEPLCE